MINVDIISLLKVFDNIMIIWRKWFSVFIQYYDFTGLISYVESWYLNWYCKDNHKFWLIWIIISLLKVFDNIMIIWRKMDFWTFTIENRKDSIMRYKTFLNGSPELWQHTEGVGVWVFDPYVQSGLEYL